MLFDEQLKPMKGAFELIHTLRSIGVDYCVASNSERDKILEILALANMADNFSGRVFSAFDANSWKPEPDLLLYTALNMGFSPQDCIYIDDTLNGVEAGIRSGIKTLYFRPDTPGTFVDHPSVCTITNLKQVIPMINVSSTSRAMSVL